MLDEKIVVDFRDLGVQLAEKNSSSRVTKNQRIPFTEFKSEILNKIVQESKNKKNMLADENMIREFALGDIQKCFGSDFAVYKERNVQRNPNKDLCLVSRVYDFKGERMQFENQMAIVSEYDVPENAWYFKENS